MTIKEILQQATVIPVMVIEELNTAVPLAKALVAGGLRVLEITLRTPVALEAISQIRAAVPEAIVGAGTVLRPEQFTAIKAAGAAFAVSPGLTQALHSAADQMQIPYLPGAVTASEIMAAMDLGYRTLKFFPAEAHGGITTLKGYQAIFAGLQFCPTGGIKQETAANYLALDNVAAVGGTWFFQGLKSYSAAELARVTEIARQCV